MADKLKKVPARFYPNENGTEPVGDWLQDLDLAKKRMKEVTR